MTIESMEALARELAVELWELSPLEPVFADRIHGNILRAFERVAAKYRGSGHDDGWNAGIEAAVRCLRGINVVETVYKQTHGEDGIETLKAAEKAVLALKIEASR